MECLYLKRYGDGWKLKRNHNYYNQVMMQLAVTGLDCALFGTVMKVTLSKLILMMNFGRK